MSTMTERLLEALNSHDAERMAALFADDYESAQPTHPGRAFSGHKFSRIGRQSSRVCLT